MSQYLTAFLSVIQIVSGHFEYNGNIVVDEVYDPTTSTIHTFVFNAPPYASATCPGKDNVFVVDSCLNITGWEGTELDAQSTHILSKEVSESI